MSEKFDQIPDEPYGDCLTCQMQLDQKSDADEHLNQTMQGPGPSHRIGITNPTRDQRIEYALDTVIDDALYEVGNQIKKMIDRDELSLEEARSALDARGIDERYLE